jgi:hypothetical protein
MWWHTVTHGWESEGETGEWSGQPVLFTLPRNMVYPALLSLLRTHRLPVVDWTEAPADLNGLVCFTERRDHVSARVPSHFKLKRAPFYTRNCSSCSLGFSRTSQPWTTTRDGSVRHCAGGIAVFNRRVFRLCVGASVSLHCMVIDESSIELVRFHARELSRKEDKFMFAGNVVQVLTLSVKLATFRLFHITVPWLFFPCHINFYVPTGRHEHVFLLFQLYFATQN